MNNKNQNEVLENIELGSRHLNKKIDNFSEMVGIFFVILVNFWFLIPLYYYGKHLKKRGIKYEKNNNPPDF